MSVREAQAIGKPVIITAYSTAMSQLENNVDGVIIPLDNEKCAEGIVDFINNDKLRDSIKTTLQKKDYQKKQEIEKIFAIF